MVYGCVLFKYYNYCVKTELHEYMQSEEDLSPERIAKVINNNYNNYNNTLINLLQIAPTQSPPLLNIIIY